METSKEQEEDALADKLEEDIQYFYGDRRMTSDELRKYLDSLKISPNKDTYK